MSARKGETLRRRYTLPKLATEVRKGPVPKVNVLRDGVEEAAEAVKLHVMARGTTDVFIDDDGYLRLDRLLNEGRFTREDHWRVGQFSRRAPSSRAPAMPGEPVEMEPLKIADIEDAIVVRLNEIRQPTRAAA